MTDSNDIQSDTKTADRPLAKSGIYACRKGGCKMYDYLKAVSIEIYLGITLMVTTMLATPLQELTKQKSCLQYYNLSLNSCQAMFANESWNSEVKDAITRLTSNYQMYGEMLALLPAMVLGLFLGPWSDRYGRRIPMMVATVGSALKVLGIILNVVFFDLALAYTLLPQLIQGVSGGILMMIGPAYSLASEQTTEANRAMKFFSVEMAFVFAGPLGSLVSGQLYKCCGFLAVFLMTEALTVFSIIVLVVLVRDIDKAEDKVGTMLRSLFSTTNLRELFQTGLMKRPNRIRPQLWMLILTMCITMLCIAGPQRIAYLYTVHNFGWSLDRFTVVETIGTLSSNLIMIPIMVVLTKVKKVPDHVLGLLGCFSLTAQNLLRACVSNEWIMGPHWIFYISYPAGMASSVSSVAIRSRMSILVYKEELGKVFSLLVTCESVIPLVAMTLCTYLFNISLNFFSGLPYLVSACLLIAPIFCFMWLSRIPLPSYEKLESVNTVLSDEVKNTTANGKMEST